jgi:glucose-6-phosphate 1-dehydrogenase
MNHTCCAYEIADLLQVLSIVTMERPVSFSAEDIRDEKVSAFLP